MTLFELDSRIRAFLDDLYTNVDEDGVVDADFEALEEMQAERNDKLESIALYIKELTAEAKAVKEEADRLADRAKATTKKAERLKEYLSQSLIQANERDFSTARCKVSFRRSETVVIPDIDRLDNHYVTTETTYKANKTKIKEDIKNGLTVEGAYLQENQNIQIK